MTDNSFAAIDPRSTGATAYANVGNSVMPTRRGLPRRLLGVWAHPDDEAYLSAGLMARVIGGGGAVTVLTATRGEKGTNDPDDHGSVGFGRFRERELRASLRSVGVTDLRFLGFRDGECDLADDEKAIAAIRHVIRATRPDTVITFGPDGITNHADHRAVSRWTTEAWRRETKGELLYATMTHDYVARHRVMHEQLGVFADFERRQPVSVGRAQIALECSLTPNELDRKRFALAAHASQTTPLAALMGEEAFRTWWQDERFRRPTKSEIARCELPARMRMPLSRRNKLGELAEVSS